MTTPRLSRVRHPVEEVSREPCRGATHDHTVHAIRSGAERAAEAGGAELQAGCEPILECVEVAASDEVFELGPGGRVRIFLEPPGRRGEESVAHRSSVVSAIAGRGPIWLITWAAAIEPSCPHRANGMPRVRPNRKPAA